MEKKVIVTKNAAETQKAGFDFAEKLKPGDVVLLQGELGAGKTTFMQGVGRYFGIKGRIISPTFVIVRQYKVRIKNKEFLSSSGQARIKNLYHIDLYRLENENEIENLGLRDFFDDENEVTFIEWGERSRKIKYNWEIRLEIIGEKERKIIVNRK